MHSQPEPKYSALASACKLSKRLLATGVVPNVCLGLDFRDFQSFWCSFPCFLLIFSMFLLDFEPESRDFVQVLLILLLVCKLWRVSRALSRLIDRK